MINSGSYTNTSFVEVETKFLTVDEVAEQLRLSKSAVYSLIHKGLLPVFRFGGAIRVSQQQLDEFIQSSSYG